MATRKRFSSLEHPLALGSFHSWVRLVHSSHGIDHAYRRRALAVSFSTLLTSPLRLYEAARYGRAVQATRIQSAPVFILGHWRTGTTHLQNLLCQDRQFGYVSTFQAMAPGFCLMGERRIKPLLARLIRRAHPTREIDNIPLSMDAPQEESFALANMSICSSLHVYALPRQAAAIFEKYALLDNLTAAERAEWTEAYLTLLRKATLRSQGRRLVLKDPCNTGRIGVLLELFPQAKFIHICRDPYRVFRSTVNTHRIVLPKTQLQLFDPSRFEELTISFYMQLMQKFLTQKSLIPAGNLVEVKYEDLEAAPMQQLRRVYEALSLPGFAQAEPAFAAYLESVKDFQKNTYCVDDAAITYVNRHWQFALAEWGYARLEPRVASELKA